MKCLLSLQKNVKCLRKLSSSSTPSHVTIENILSKDNENRCKAQLAAMSMFEVQSKRPLTKNVKGTKKAAVLVPLCTINCQPSIIFTLRSNKLYKYRGEVSFPGGMADASDVDPVATALRESFEELGLQPGHVNVWGTMPAHANRDGHTMITPVIGYLGDVDLGQMKLNYDEVECVFTRNIYSLCNAKNLAATTFRTGSGYTLPVFLGGEHRIWGLTACILHQALTIIAPGMYRPALPTLVF